jgi:hypothetical protein
MAVGRLPPAFEAALKTHGQEAFVKYGTVMDQRHGTLQRDYALGVRHPLFLRLFDVPKNR